MSISRSMQTRSHAEAAAFDFDVVTDMPPRRPQATAEPQPAPKAAPPAVPSEAAE